jgi:hypothetical protein
LSLVELARYSDAALAHIVRGRLEAVGIPAHCFDTGMNFAEGVPMLFQVRVMVLDDDLEAAQRLIAEAPMRDDEHIDLIPREAEGYTSARRRHRWAFYLLAFLCGPPLLFNLVSCVVRTN